LCLGGFPGKGNGHSQTTSTRASLCGGKGGYCIVVKMKVFSGRFAVDYFAQLEPCKVQMISWDNDRRTAVNEEKKGR